MENLEVFRTDASRSKLMEAKNMAIEECLKPRSRNDTALMIVDMQRGFLDDGAALEVPGGSGECLSNAVRLVAKARTIRMQVVFTQYIHRPGSTRLSSYPFSPEVFEHSRGAPKGPFHPSSCCMEGDLSVEVVEDLRPRADDLVVEKYGYDSFHETPLDSELRSRGISHLYVCGVLTDICVDSTLRSGFHREYRITAVSDAVATIRPEIQEACLDIWRREFARVRSTADVLAEMDGLA